MDILKIHEQGRSELAAARQALLDKWADEDLQTKAARDAQMARFDEGQAASDAAYVAAGGTLAAEHEHEPEQPV